MHLNPQIYTNPAQFKEFGNIIDTLAKFRDPNNDAVSRIFLQNISSPGQINAYNIGLQSKPKLFRRLIEFFWKPKHLRLSFVVDKTIAFLESNQDWIEKGEHVEKLKVFQMRLYTIHKVHKKVAPSVFNRLDKLISNVEQSKKKKKTDAETLAEKELLNAQSEADKIIADSETFKQKQITLHSDIQKDTAKEITKLQKEIDKTIQLGDTIQLNAQVAIDSARHLNRKVSFAFVGNEKYAHLADKTEEHDLRFLCSNDEVVTAHSFLFPAFLKKHAKKKRVTEMTYLSGKTVKTVHIQEYKKETISLMVRLAYGKKEEVVKNFFEFVLTIAIPAKGFKMTSLDKVVTDELKKIFQSDPYAVVDTAYELLEKYELWKTMKGEAFFQMEFNALHNFALEQLCKLNDLSSLKIPKECFLKMAERLTFYLPIGQQIINNWKQQKII